MIKETNRLIGDYGEFLNYSDTFVETGSCYGRSIQLALAAGYKKVYSVEAKEEYYEHCKNLFKDNSDIHLYLGKSVDRLEEMLNQIVPFTAVIFLDAHVSGEASAGYKDWVEKQEESDYDQHKCLMAELSIIHKHANPLSVIIIDDQNGYNDKTEEYIKALLEINPYYKLRFFDEQMGENFYKNKMLVATP